VINLPIIGIAGDQALTMLKVLQIEDVYRCARNALPQSVETIVRVLVINPPVIGIAGDQALCVSIVSYMIRLFLRIHHFEHPDCVGPVVCILVINLPVVAIPSNYALLMLAVSNQPRPFVTHVFLLVYVV
jgi:hypothetical protein